MIEFKAVTKRFGSKTVLDDLSFKIEAGEIVFVIGKSGMGKSVLLKNIVGLVRPDAGEIWVDGEEVSHLTEEAYFEVRRKCGMVFQFPALLDSLNVYENLAFGVKAHKVCESEAEVRKLVVEKLRLVNLDEKILPRYPLELSFGMQKRVSIARTIAVGPQYLLFDEPTTGLDPVSTNAINQLILSLSRGLNVTSVVVSHDMHCALDIADRIILLDRGKVAVAGNPQELIFSDHPLARDFLKEAMEKRRAAEAH